MVMDTAQRKFSLPEPLPDAAKVAITLPIQFGGLGLRKVASISVPAYFCAALNAAQDIVRDLDEKSRNLLLPTQFQAPFAREIDRCLKVLQDAGVSSGPEGLIPESSNDFWKPNGTPSIPQRQKGICKLIAASEQRELLNAPSIPRRDKQRIISSEVGRVAEDSFTHAREINRAGKTYSSTRVNSGEVG